ncbi:hypothetical protein QGM71_07580 [Virgibacillus sp. C22-A2]|uniref:Uncharacterized protein n=1 Tax=Virgibacillus tibetensis TaxID=3042313 RepID=A0ABU6KDE2_9BACI|nr:hypothetical protein [Virgibacillus sp. C22-A2]
MEQGDDYCDTYIGLTGTRCGNAASYYSTQIGFGIPPINSIIVVGLLYLIFEKTAGSKIEKNVA